MSSVRTLYHFPLDPASRQVRLALEEKKLPYNEEVVRYWEQPKDFVALNPSGLTPVLVEKWSSGDALVICEVRAILEHLTSEVSALFKSSVGPLTYCTSSTSPSYPMMTRRTTVPLICCAFATCGYSGATE